MTIDKTELFTVRETGGILKVSTATIYRMMSKEVLSWHEVEGVRRVSQAQIDDYLSRTERGARDAT